MLKINAFGSFFFLDSNLLQGVVFADTQLVSFGFHDFFPD
jgi:hypothetical protein